MAYGVPSPPPSNTQNNWAWCKKCQGMFYGPNQRNSVCPVDLNNHDGSGSYNYNLPYNIVGGPGLQANWKWCSKCQGLSYSPNVNVSICPADYRHHGITGNDYGVFWYTGNLP
jgi:hypothetical protein